MLISDWSSDVCSSDLKLKFGADGPLIIIVDVVAGELVGAPSAALIGLRGYTEKNLVGIRDQRSTDGGFEAEMVVSARHKLRKALEGCRWIGGDHIDRATSRSAEHTSELQSRMRISYAVLCLKKTTDYD